MWCQWWLTLIIDLAIVSVIHVQKSIYQNNYIKVMMRKLLTFLRGHSVLMIRWSLSSIDCVYFVIVLDIWLITKPISVGWIYILLSVLFTFGIFGVLVLIQFNWHITGSVMQRREQSKLPAVSYVAFVIVVGECWCILVIICSPLAEFVTENQYNVNKHSHYAFIILTLRMILTLRVYYTSGTPEIPMLSVRLFSPLGKSADLP